MSTPLGEYIARRRAELGYTSQAGFARAAKISPSHLNQIETGKIALPNADLRRKLAIALGVRHVDILVAAGELGENEVDLPQDLRSGAVMRLQPVIDQIRWDEKLYTSVESTLNMIRDLQQGIYWDIERSDQEDNTADMTPENVRPRREATERGGRQ